MHQGAQPKLCDTRQAYIENSGNEGW